MIREEAGMHTTIVRCPECADKNFNVKLTKDMIESIERFPFEIVLMHVCNIGEKKIIHTLVAYIDKNFECKHAVCLTGKRVIITPYILYNPNLLYLSCYKDGD